MLVLIVFFCSTNMILMPMCTRLDYIRHYKLKVLCQTLKLTFIIRIWFHFCCSFISLHLLISPDFWFLPFFTGLTFLLLQECQQTWIWKKIVKEIIHREFDESSTNHKQVNEHINRKVVILLIYLQL